MYEAFYSFRDKPFQLNPDPTFYFGSRQHKRAMSYLDYGLHQNEGFIVITGEIGAGKTTLVRSLFEKLDGAKVVAAHMVTTQLDAADTLRMVAAAFGVPSKGMQKSDLLLGIEAFLVSTASTGKRCLLVVDEAQNLTPTAVEELRMLSNFQLETHALLQTFLVGQPEFRLTLQGPAMEQLRQRVIATAHIGAMSAPETQAYIEHRLSHVGWNGSPHFDPEAYRAIHEHSTGIPRRINAICDRLLWYGYLADRRSFVRKDVMEVAEEMKDEVRIASQGEGSGDLLPPQVQRTTPKHAKVTSNVPKSPFATEPQLGEQLTALDRDFRKLEASILRMEHTSLETIKLFRHVVNLLGKNKDVANS
jgi:general secretion pathway protein A